MDLGKHQIARQFSRAAETYDDVSSLQNQMADRLIERVTVDANRTLVDLGCGTGYAIQKFSKSHNLELIGVDIAQGMIDKGNKRFSLLSNSRPIELIVADLEQTGLKVNTADFVFSNAAIQWCNLDRAFLEMKRILKPDGTLFVSTFGPATLQTWRTAWQSIGDHCDRVHEFQSASSVQQSLENSGLTQLDWAVENLRLEFSNVREMFQSIKKLGATNASTNRSTGLLGKQKYRLLCEYFEQRLKAEGTLKIEFECFYLIAKL